MIRDDVAMDILKRSIQSLQMDTDWIIRNVTALAMEAIQLGETGSTETEEQLLYKTEQITKKKETVLEAFFSQTVTKEEMRLMNDKYDGKLAELQTRLQAVREKDSLCYDTKQLAGDIRKEVTSVLRGKAESEVFCKNILDHMTVFKDNRMELRLNLLPHKWVLVLEKLCDFRQKTVVSLYDSAVSAEIDVQKSEENQGLSASVSLGVCDLPISVSSPCTSG